MKKKIRNFIKCNKCGRLISKSNITKHYHTDCVNAKRHEKINKEWKQNNGKYKCPHCYKQFSYNGVSTHIWRMHTEKGKDHKTKHIIGHKAWNKGFTKKTNLKVKEISKKIKQVMLYKVKCGTFKPNISSAEYRRKLSISQSLHNTGGRCKWYRVDNQKVQGTWERDLAIKFSKLGIKWQKLKLRKDILYYNIDSKIKPYTPDFYLSDFDTYLEVKGFWWGNDKVKMQKVSEQHSDKNIVLIMKDKYQLLLKAKTIAEVAQILVER